MLHLQAYRPCCVFLFYPQAHVESAALNFFQAAVEACVYLDCIRQHAFNDKRCCVLFLQAHVESVALNAFQAAVEACIDPDCRRALKALCDLFALRCIEKDTLFRNDEYVAPAKVRAVCQLAC